MKRRESVLSSSSSRRDTLPGYHHAKNVGCMSGIFHLVSKYSQRRKFLTFGIPALPSVLISGKKEDKSAISSPAKPKQIPTENEALVAEKTPSLELRRFSCDVQRSPTIQSDIRRSSSVNSPVQSHRPPAIVAKLMGFDDATAESPSPASTADKRRKLLEALEKCDEDLKSLKKIIDAVRSHDHVRSSPATEAISGGSKGQSSPRLITKQSSDWAEVVKDQKNWSSDEIDGRDSITRDRKLSDFSSDRPSPVSVLDEISSSPSLSCRSSNVLEKGEKYTKQREESTNLSFFHTITLESLPRFSCRGGQYLGSTTTATKTNWELSWYWNSTKAKIESVMEVCEEAVWEARWEMGRIGVMLEDYMLGDLIEETVRELGYCHYMYVLPFEACKRKLSF